MQDIKKFYLKRIEDNAVWDKIEAEVFIILTRENEEKVFRLNKTAGYIWENSDGTKTVQKLLEELCLKYDIDEKKALDDTIEFVEQMKNLQLLALYDSSS